MPKSTKPKREIPPAEVAALLNDREWFEANPTAPYRVRQLKPGEAPEIYYTRGNPWRVSVRNGRPGAWVYDHMHVGSTWPSQDYAEAVASYLNFRYLIEQPSRVFHAPTDNVIPFRGPRIFYDSPPVDDGVDLSGLEDRSKKACALSLASRGYRVFPLQPGGKVPLAGSSGCHDATLSAEAIDHIWNEYPDANIGIAPDDSFVVVDIDVKDGKAGLASAKAAGVWPQTGANKTVTASGGYHLFFRTDERHGNRSGVMDGIDIRGFGGYVVAPGSAVDGREYVGTLPPRSELPLASPQVKALLTRKKDQIDADHESAVELDLPDNLQAARDYLAKRDPAIQGEGGDLHTFVTAQHLRELGLEAQTTLNVMLEDWNDRCEPPWEADDMAVKVASAYRSMQTETGSKAPTAVREALLATVTPEQRQRTATTTTGDPGPIRYSELTAKIPAPVEYLIPGLVLKREVNFLYGDGGVNKSRVAAQFGMAIQHGANVFGRATKPATFVHVSCENGVDEDNRRARMIAKGMGIDDKGEALYWDRKGSNSVLATVYAGGGFEVHDFYHRLASVLASIEGHKFLLLDSLYDFVSIDKIDEAAARAFIKQVLEPLCVNHDTTIFILAHPSQQGMDTGRGYSGSVAWNNAPRNRLYIERTKDDSDVYRLSVKKTNVGALEEITLFWADGVLLPDGQFKKRDHSREIRLREAIRLAVAAADSGAPNTKQRYPEKWQLDEFEKTLGQRPTNRQFKDYLAEALSKGLLRYQKGYGKTLAGYYPPAEPVGQ